MSRKRFRARTCHGECGDPLCSGSHVGVAAPSPYKPGVDWTLRDDLSVEQVLDEMSLLHAMETAGALSEAEQEAIEAREHQTDELAE